jgi:DNA helicase-2/ATP-dependent DNA helicase PcrA
MLRLADNPRNRIAAFRVLQLMPGMGPAHSARICDAIEAADFRITRFKDLPVPAAARETWTAFCALLVAIGAADAPWAGQLAQLRAWYEPQLERLYEHAAPRRADLEQLERIAVQYQTREAFVTELTLDPPQATGDLSGEPLLDEDYLVLSTVHSAKGQEWESVYVLNVTDGSFPSEFATGRPESIAEERRLLYVAMTRAKRELHLLAPVRFYVTRQSPVGDRYVTSARSRFLTDAVLKQFEQRSWSATPTDRDEGPAPSGPRVDVGARLREMW